MDQKEYRPTALRPINTIKRGQSLLEFALVLPIILLIVMGIFDLGWAVYAQNTIALAAREGARYGIISTRTDADIQDRVITTATGLGLTPGQITIAPGGARVRGGTVTVSVTYIYNPITPLIGWAVGAGGGITLTSNATMYVE